MCATILPREIKAKSSTVYQLLQHLSLVLLLFRNLYFRETLGGSFSAVLTLSLPSKYLVCSIFQDLHTSASLQPQRLDNCAFSSSQNVNDFKMVFVSCNVLLYFSSNQLLFANTLQNLFLMNMKKENELHDFRRIYNDHVARGTNHLSKIPDDCRRSGNFPNKPLLASVASIPPITNLPNLGLPTEPPPGK